MTGQAVAGLVEQGGTSAGRFAPVPGTRSCPGKTRRAMESAHGSSARVGDHQVPGSQGGEGSNAEVPPVFQTES